MKENFQKAKTKVVDAGKKVHTIVTEFVSEHPDLTVAIFTVGVTGIAALSVHKFKETYYENILKNDGRVYTKVDKGDSLWREEYRETYDKVNAFADTLNLVKGEMYIIEDQTQFCDSDCYSKMDRTRPIVSHMIFNEGVYPDE
jgi:hypothetical protein